jgi:mRNA-degrading endonuclease YafQ of YafQ-DinJ toxin-antitoxin module
MLQVALTPQFRRMFKRLEKYLQLESIEKIEQFKDPTNHKPLKVHKLKGGLKRSNNFSVNYKTRVVFEYEKHDSSSVILTAIGNHDVYK